MEATKRQPSPLTEDERLELLRRLMNLNIFLLLDYIVPELKELASAEEQYVDVVSQIVNKVKMDLAQGSTITALIEIGASSPQVGIDLAAAMRRRDDETLIVYSSFPLGGAGRADYTRVKTIIDTLWKSGNPLYRLVTVKTYRIIFSPFEKIERPIPPDVFSFMENASLSPDPAIVQEAADGLFDFAKIDEPRVMSTLTRLAKQNSMVRGRIARRLEFKGTLSVSNTAMLLKLLMTDEDQNVLSCIARVLGYYGSEFPREAMEIIIALAIRGKYHIIHLLDYAAEQVGAADVKGAIELIQRTLQDPTPGTFAFIAQYLLVDASKSNFLLLTDYLKKWLLTPTLRTVALKTSREMLGHVFETQTVSIADSFYPTLKSDAIANGINIDRILQGKTSKIDQCIELVDELLVSRPQLDYAKIEQNWQRFPALREFLSDQWLKKKKAENNKTHEILYDLAESLT